VNGSDDPMNEKPHEDGSGKPLDESAHGDAPEGTESQPAAGHELPPIDLSDGIVLGGICRSEDVRMAELLPARAQEPKKTRNNAFVRVLFSAVAFVLIAILFWPRGNRPGPPPEPERPTEGWSQSYFMGGVALGMGGFFTWLYFLGKKQAPTIPDERVQFVFHEDCFYVLQERWMRQVAWREPRLWQSDRLLMLLDARRFYTLPRRLCRDDAQWNELRAWFAERMNVTEVSLPDDYDGTGSHETFDVRGGWGLDIHSRPIASSHGPITGNDLPSVGFRMEKILGGVTVAAVAAAVLLPIGNMRWLLIGFAAAIGFIAALLGVLVRLDTRIRRQIDEAETFCVIRESCVELVGPSGRMMFRWDGLRRNELSDQRIVLLCGDGAWIIVLPRRIFAESDWRRIQDRVLGLPEARPARG